MQIDDPARGFTFKHDGPLDMRMNPKKGLSAAHWLARASVEELASHAPGEIDVVVGMEARGFIFAAPVALQLGAGFVPVRKPGKLPGKVLEETFSLEYGHETLTILHDSLFPGARVMVVDDILATGGTVGATASLIKQLGARLVHVAVLMELGFLTGRSALTRSGIDSFSAVVTV